MQVEIEFVAIRDEATLEEHREAVESISRFLPEASTREPDFSDDFETLQLIRVNGVAVGLVSFDLYQYSAEMHGLLRSDFDELFYQAKQIKVQLYRHLFDWVFNTLNKRKVVIKGKPDDKRLKGFAWMFRFRTLPNMDNGQRVWVLHRKEYS